MVPIREIEVETKTQARILEEEMRIQYNAQMNTNRAYRSEEERIAQLHQYLQSDACKESRRKYAQTDAAKENKRKHAQTDAAKEVKRQYRQSDVYKEYQKQYRLAKKAKLAESPEIIVSA